MKTKNENEKIKYENEIGVELTVQSFESEIGK